MQGYDGAVDEPLKHLLTDPRAARTSVIDNLWVRLVDVGRALAVGGTTLSSLAAAGRVEELRSGAVTAASLAFRGEREPFHPSGWAFPAF
ncbi:hypothetical protein ABGB14_35535 [Nonomuraea sp. B10E15]|uniref:hypothetical protein n=1 Tax=Nonomuraea sp. B10E15 TaxID=3153560 RepID=UPI00325ECA7A